MTKFPGQYTIVPVEQPFEIYQRFTWRYWIFQHLKLSCTSKNVFNEFCKKKNKILYSNIYWKYPVEVERSRNLYTNNYNVTRDWGISPCISRVPGDHFSLVVNTNVFRNTTLRKIHSRYKYLRIGKKNCPNIIRKQTVKMKRKPVIIDRENKRAYRGEPWWEKQKSPSVNAWLFGAAFSRSSPIGLREYENEIDRDPAYNKAKRDCLLAFSNNNTVCPDVNRDADGEFSPGAVFLRLRDNKVVRTSNYRPETAFALKINPRVVRRTSSSQLRETGVRRTPSSARQ